MTGCVRAKHVVPLANRMSCVASRQPASRIRDVVIVGSGPAGYAAAIYAARAGLDTLVVDGRLPGGALMAAGQMDNYPGFSVPVCGPSLARAMRAQAHRFGAEFHTGDVNGFDLEGEVKSVAIDHDLRHASALILAMGAVNRPLNVPGERKLRGKGVSASAKRDGQQFADREVAVVGGGDAATEEALFLAPLARRVTVIHHRPRLRASTAMAARLRAQPNIVVLNSTEVLAVKGRHHVTGLRVRRANTPTEYEIHLAAVFVAIGQTPRSDLLIGLVDLDARGHVLTRDAGTHTHVDGVFAAGDLIDHRYRQAVTAAASGCQPHSTCSVGSANHTRPQPISPSGRTTRQNDPVRLDHCHRCLIYGRRPRKHHTRTGGLLGAMVRPLPCRGTCARRNRRRVRRAPHRGQARR